MSGRLEMRIGRREWIGVALLLVLALVLRVGFVLMQQPGFYFQDSLDYDRAARAYGETGHFDATYYRFPLYPLFMAISYKLFGTGLTPFRILQGILGTATCLLIWLIGRRLFGARAALLALTGAALFPVHVILAGIEYPVALGTFMIWAALAAYVGASASPSPSVVGLVVIGFATALAMMIFEGGIALEVFLILAFWSGSESRKEFRRRVLVLGISIALVLAPWVVGMVRAADYRPLVLKAGIHLPSAPGIDPPIWAGSGENLLGSKLSGVVHHPGWMIHHSWSEFLHFWDPYPDRMTSADEKYRLEFHQQDQRMVTENSLVGEQPRLLYAVGFSLLLAAAGLGALVAGHEVAGSGFLIGWPVFLGLCYSPFFTQMRYRIPADPAFLLLGAYALDLALERTLWTKTLAALKALWEWWKRVALKIAMVQTFLLLFLLFFVGLGPIALFLKLFRKDPMHAPLAPGSFWALREKTREGMEECLRQF